jgi:hypothetical protein
MQALVSFPGSGYRLGGSQDSFFGKTSQFVVNALLPKLYQYTPNAFISLLQEKFWTIPATALAVSMVYDKTFALDTVLAGATGLISYADPKISNRKVVKSAALSLFAFHTMKCGYNSYTYVCTRELSSALGASLDLCIAAKNGLILLSQLKTRGIG